MNLLVIVASYGYVAETQSLVSSSQFNHIIVWRSYAMAVKAHAKNVNLKCNLSHHQYRQLSILHWDVAFLPSLIIVCGIAPDWARPVLVGVSTEVVLANLFKLVLVRRLIQPRLALSSRHC